MDDFLDIVGDLLLITDGGGRIVAASASWRTDLGHRPDDLIGRSWRELVHPADAAAAAEPRDEVRVRLRGADGTYRPYRGRVAGSGDRVRLAFSPEASPAVGGVERAGLVEHVLTQLPALLWTTDADLRFTSSTGAGLKLLGLVANETVGMTLFEYFQTDDAEIPPIAAHRSALAGTPGSYDFVWEDTTWATHVEPLTDAGGAIVGTIGLAVDVSAQRRVENELRAERERLAVTLRSIGDAVIVTDREHRVTLLNTVAEDLTGWTEREAIGEHITRVFEIINEDTGELVRDPCSLVFEQGAVVGLANHTVLVARDGRERSIADSGAPVRAADGTIDGVVIVFRDVTVERVLERELNRAQRMEALGVLAGGIAHDFNNMLTMIMANVSVARRESPPGSKLSEILADVEAATARATGLTGQLLTFSRGGAPVRKLASVEPVIRDTVDFAMRGARSRCEVEIAPDLAPAEFDEGQLSQVLSNLLINAHEAMPGGGVIRVSARNRDLAGGNELGAPAGRYLEICVRDQGPGIAADRLDRIFEPFYSTKARGSGLGLAVAHSIVSAHDGYLTVSSRPGEGTSFVVLLPAAHPREAPPAGAESATAPAGSGRVLVMEDEPAIRAVAGRMLEALGYACECVPEGEAAIEAFTRARAAGRPFAAVILDLTVPGAMGGLETIRRLRELEPEVKAIVSSGYTADSALAHHREHGFRGVLVKPYGLDQLASVLAEVLGET